MKKASRQVLRANRARIAFAQASKHKAPRAQRRKIAKGLVRQLSIIDK